MPSALEDIRAHRMLVQEVQAQLADVRGVLQALREEASKLTDGHELRTLLQEEQAWLARAEAVVREARTVRELEIARPRRMVWRRWVIAIVLGVAAAAACGAGYGWAAKPSEAQLATFRERADFLDFVAQRVITMTPAERREFDVLMTRPKPGPKPGS